MGIHDSDLANIYKAALDLFDYKIINAESLDEMLQTIESENLLRNKEFQDVYLMDVNLGMPNGDSIEPGKVIYNLIKSSVKSGNSKYMSISGNADAVAEAKKQGVRCMKKYDFSLRDFIKNK